MLNFIWAGMIMLGILYAAVTGHMDLVTKEALNSAGEAVSLCITMAGVVALWMGLMEIAKDAGIIQKLTKWISPFLDFMFPRIPANHPAREYISANIIANVLGLGWACTPAGLKAMEALSKLQKERTGEDCNIASNEMCDFLILNISSLQLIPVNMIAYRSEYGSVNPEAIIAPALLATLVSTLTAIIFCKCRRRASY